MSVSRDWADWGVWVFSLLLVVVGGLQVWFLYRTLGAIKRQADLMDQQGEFATKQLGLTQRPWIHPAVSLISPLNCNDSGASITLKIVLENVGNTPAIGIWVDPVMYIPKISKPHAIDERKRLCEEILNRKPDWGHIIFPGKNVIQHITVNANASDIESCLIGERFYSVEIILCVAYRSTLEEAARYYTGVIYNLNRVESEHPNMCLALRVGEGVPFERLHLEMSPIAAIIAK